MKKYIIFLFVICFSAFTGCKKDKDQHPEIQSLTIEALSPTKALLKGNIVNTGTFKVVDYGFIYGTSSNLSETYGAKVSLGSSPAEGAISKEIQNLTYSSSSRILYARAYLTNSNGTVFGQVISAQLPTVSTGSIVPASGKAGDQITINGQFYSLTKDEVSVLFGGVTAKIIDISSTKLTVEVPVGINTYNYSNNQVSLTVYAGGQQVYQNYSFKVIPTFKAFTPTSGTIGTSVTITGDNIPNYYSYYNTVKVFFGQTLASISNMNSNGIVAIVPAGITEAKSAISVEFEGIKAALPGEFTLVPPTISAISPSSGLPGGVFSIFGSNFPNNYSSNNTTVTLGGIPATVYWYSSGQLNVTIPTNLPVGDYKVVVKSGPFNVEATQTLKVQALTLSSFSPSSGGVGKEVTLQGLFIPNQSYQVYFGNTSTYATSISSTMIKATVPYGTTAGNTKIILKYGSQTVESSDEFTVLAPSITSFAPTSGVAGTTVTISGNGFNPYTYNNTVKFGTIQAPILSATESTLTVTVPSNISPAAMKITVISNGQTIVSSGNFTVN